MYAVIKTGGKQYRVRAGDLLVVEKLDGAPGAKLSFDEVLMIGEGAAVTMGAPMIEGALVSATLVETRKGEKIKVFKKIRRQGYRRTRGHRQFQSVLRVTGIAGAGQEDTWDGAIDLTPLAVLNARARNLARGMETAQVRAAERAERAERKASGAAAPMTPKSPAAKSNANKAKAPAKAKVAKPTAKAASAKRAAAKAPAEKAKTAKAKPEKAKAAKAKPAKAETPAVKKPSAAKRVKKT